MDKKTFWMVIRESGGDKPTKRHTSYDEAFEEAQRLALKESHVYHVLEAKAVAWRSSEIKTLALEVPAPPAVGGGG